MFDGVDAEVGFEVEFGVEHLGRIAGLRGDDGEDLLDDRVGFACRSGGGVVGRQWVWPLRGLTAR